MRFIFAILFFFFSATAQAEYIAGRDLATQKVLNFISENGVYPLNLVETFKKTLQLLKVAFPQLVVNETPPNLVNIQCQGVSAALTLAPDSAVAELFRQIKPVLDACALNDDLKEELASTESYENFILGYFVAAYHPKANYYKPSSIDIYRDGASGAVGLVLKNGEPGLEIASTVAGSPAEQSGLKSGDKLVKIGDADVTNLKLEEAALKLRGVENTKIDLTIMPRGQTEPRIITITRQNMILKSVQYDVIGSLGYLKIGSFDPSTSLDFNLALQFFIEKAVTGIILDLRNNDGGLIDVAITIADRFLNGNLTIVSLTGQAPQTYKITQKTNQITLPLTILINSKTASAAEVLVGALKDYKRGTIMGERSAGKGSVRTVFTVNDYKMEIPVALAITPKGRTIEGVGIEPDKNVPEGNFRDSPKAADPIVQAALVQMANVNKPLDQAGQQTTAPATNKPLSPQLTAPLPLQQTNTPPAVTPTKETNPPPAQIPAPDTIVTPPPSAPVQNVPSVPVSR